MSRKPSYAEMMSDLYPTDITADEEAAGFQPGQMKNPVGHYGSPFGSLPPPSHVSAVVRPLPHGQKAVKVRCPNGDIRYAIHNDSGRPVKDAAYPLPELQRRFPPTLSN